MSLEQYKDDIYTCNRTRCGFCREACPMYEHFKFEIYSSRGKMQVARGLLEGKVKPSKELMEVLSLCAACGYCQYKCALNNVEIFQALRQYLIEHGVENDFHKRAIKQIIEKSNPFGLEKDKRVEWAKDFKFDTKSEILFFAGCTYSYHLPEDIKKILQILNKANIKLNYLNENEFCCGSLIHLAGYKENFEDLVKKNYQVLKEKGIKEIITACPSCYKMFNNEYPKILEKFEIKVYHLLEYLIKIIIDGKIKLKKPIKMKVTWHDPCDLGRHSGIFEEPRELLKMIPGIELKEMKHNRLDSRCCGAGGGVMASNADITMDLALKRVKEAEELGVDAIITMCPTCEESFSKIIRYEDLNIKVIDLGNLILDSMD
ncbi:MAG: (Fe-S)-binding protein [Candidatus Lokiarchaeota archaeon]|nr:(Fe-S)-binding protein [Candidatus Lokiarchaeota archaeon]